MGAEHVVTEALVGLDRLNPGIFETPTIFRKLATTSRKLAELKGLAASMPNDGILINTLALQEAKDSSAIENIVTTHDELFKGDAFPDLANPVAKEVRHYIQALHVGFEQVTSTGLITNNHILDIQATLEKNRAGFRKLPGTALKDGFGTTVYTPPQDPDTIVALMRDLESFINDDTRFDADPLVKMAIIHHQFESIHPFYDGNGRTGRILNVLYLVQTAGLGASSTCSISCRKVCWTSLCSTCRATSCGTRLTTTVCCRACAIRATGRNGRCTC